MDIFWQSPWIWYVLIGSASGLLAGLLGVGGGIVIVPMLIYSLSAQHFSANIVPHLAVATSLAVIIFTSMMAIYVQNKENAILWHLVRWMTLGIVIGCVFGSWSAAQIPGHELKKYFGFFCCLMSLQMLFNWQPTLSREKNPSAGILTTGGSVTGILSAFFGVGGGTVTVPFLCWFGVPMQKAVATSSACGLPIAIVGTLSYMIFGWYKQDLPEHSLGYIYLPALVCIGLASLLTAPLGVRLSHFLPASSLKKIFALLLIVVGIGMIR